MDPTETVRALKRVPGLCEDACHVEHYRVPRKLTDGSMQTVDIRVLDFGSDATAGLRYHVEAQSTDGKTAGGNPNGKLDVALATLHWGALGT